MSTMEKCQKCGGMMLAMKIKKTVLSDMEKKQGWKCSRCGFYLERQQTFNSRSDNQPNDDQYYLRRR